MTTFPDIPDFLRVPKDYRPERPAKRLRWTNEMTFAEKKRDEHPATRKLRREIAKAEEAKKAAAAELRKERRQELQERRKLRRG